MAETRGRARQAGILAFVVLLHTGGCWLLLKSSRAVIPLESRSLDLVFIVPADTAPGGVAATGSIAATGRGTGKANSREVRRDSNLPAEPDSMPPSSAESHPVQPPVDWAGEMDRSVREAAPPPAPAREFGVPQHSAPALPKPPEFGWSHARTHRVESLPGGGLMVNVNDRCVVLVVPFPFLFCGIGKKEADGDLFKHLRDPGQPGD